ncbi:MAG: flippase-like domain-containing protein [Planctomycetota bacterium]|nr:flippase-like domain-containing protein [Planctomycetota bacterium]
MPGGGLFLFIAFGLLPGTFWRLLGRKSWNVHRAGFAAALAAYVLSTPSLRPNAETLRNISKNWNLALLGFCLSFTQPLWGGLRLHRLLGDVGRIEITCAQSVALCFSGFFFNIFLPGATGGDAYRVYVLGRQGGAGIGSAIATISLDRFLGLPSLVLIVFFGMALDWRYLANNRTLSEMVPFIAAAGGICLLLIGYLVLAGKGRRQADKIAPGEADDTRSAGRLLRLHRLLAKNVRRPATLPLALLYGALAHVATIAACQCFGSSLGISGISWMRYYLIVPMALSINVIPVAPGGVGQGELAMAALFAMASSDGANAQAGVMLMLLFRLSNIAIGLSGAVAYVAGWRRCGWKATWP